MKQSERLMSLDALRGFDMLFIMGFASLVVAVCGLWPNAVTDSIASQMGHASWDGFTHHDTIFPLFLFIAGVSFPFSLSKQRSLGLSTGTIYAKIVRRALTLVLLGVIYNGLFRLDFENLRIASVLGRIGLAWGIAAVLYLNFGVKARIAIAAAILVGYGLLSALVAAPDVAGAGPLTRGNLAGYIDRQFLPGKLIYGSFDPEGLLSTVPAVVTAMLGMFTGEFVRRSDIRGGRKTLWMAAAAAALLAAGLAFSGVLPVNKKLWSSTFVCVVAAYSLAMFALFYYLIDVRGWRRWTLFFRVVGLNSITIYLAQRIVGFGRISDFFLGGVASKCPEALAAVVNSAGYVAVCWLFLYFLYRKNVFLKV
ncbi:MAG: acyltransferase family protein [Alistipes finegoldii]